MSRDKKKLTITGQLMVNNVRDAEGNVYNLEGLEFPPCSTFKNPSGNVFHGDIRHNSKGLEIEICTRCKTDEQTMEIMQTLLEKKIPKGVDKAYFDISDVGISARGLVTEMSYKIVNPFWAFVFQFKFMRHALWFIHKRVYRIKVITGFQPLEYSIVKK
jgi:glutathionylspermidine synthase